MKPFNCMQHICIKNNYLTNSFSHIPVFKTFYYLIDLMIEKIHEIPCNGMSYIGI